jgi:stage III sporulation protein AG
MIGAGFFFFLVSYGGGTTKTTQTDSTETAKEESVDTTAELQNYQERMEKKIKNILEKAEGVENVEVMITLRASKEKVTLKDSKTESGKSEEETVLTEDENKNKEPYVVQEIEPEIEGILVVCSGGDNAGVQREIIEGISALFSIESHKIKVMKSKEAK